MTVTGMCVFSLQAEMKTTSESSLKESDSTVEESTVASKTSTTTGKSVSELFTVRSQEEQQQPKKKRKNRVQRFFSWMTKNLCCCWMGVDE